MKNKYNIPVVISFMGMCLPILGVVIMCQIEKELVEAVFGGLVSGSIAGVVFGLIALVLDRKAKQKLVFWFAIVPIVIICIYAVLFIAAGAYSG